jgi:uncharacterized protein (TIGR03083 family)
VTDQLSELQSSVDRLRTLVDPLTPARLEESAYPTEWSIADVMSHIGSGAVIFRRRIEDTRAGREPDEDFAPGVWAVWDAKSPASKTADGLVADRELVECLVGVTEDERATFRFALGPMTFGFDEFVGLRVNEHALHTWDVEVSLDPAAVVAPGMVALVIDQLGMIARFTGKPTGTAHEVRVHTTDPERHLVVVFKVDSVELAPGDGASDPDLELPAEAFVRLVYGRLDPAHSPPVDAPAIVDELRAAFPGP